MYNNDFTAKDCEKLMEEYTAYDEKIVRGVVVQLYYFAQSPTVIKSQDDELKMLAKEFGGEFTGQQGMVNSRRDIDFEFVDDLDAARFCKRIDCTARFYVHNGINVQGQVVIKPSIEELENKRNELKKINCGSSICENSNLSK